PRHAPKAVRAGGLERPRHRPDRTFRPGPQQHRARGAGMIARRGLLCAALAATMVAAGAAHAGSAAPAAAISGLYDVLLSTMKDGPSLGFKGRSERLSPAIRSAFDLPLMTRLMVGPQWATLTTDQQRQLVAAFSDFSIAVYASRFDDYSGERFQVD